MHSRWTEDGIRYTSMLSPLTMEHLCHCGTKALAGVEEMGVHCLWRGGDRLLHVIVCCKLLARQMILKGSKETEISGPYCQLGF